MYQCGDLVVYGIHGICKIVEVQTQTISGKKTQFFVLEPVEQTGTRFFVPTQNEAALAKLRPILTREELNTLLTDKTVAQDAWIPDENQRKQRYRELICSGDRAALVSMVHALHRHKQTQLAAGRKFHLCDENFLRDAEKLLGAEFALVLGIPREQVAQYVQNAVSMDN